MDRSLGVKEGGGWTSKVEVEAKGYLAQNGINEAVKNSSIKGREGKPVKSEGESSECKTSTQKMTLQEQMIILRKEQCR